MGQQQLINCSIISVDGLSMVPPGSLSLMYMVDSPKGSIMMQGSSPLPWLGDGRNFAIPQSDLQHPLGLKYGLRT